MIVNARILSFSDWIFSISIIYNMKHTDKKPVFYVEKPSKALKKYGASNDKHSVSGQKATKNKSATGGVGRESGGVHDTPEPRTSPAEHKGTGETPTGEDGKRSIQTEKVGKGEAYQSDGGTGEGKNEMGYEQGSQEAGEQGHTGNEEGVRKGSGGKENKGVKAPLSEERKAQLEAARARANEVRKERGEIRKKEKHMKDQVYEDKKRQLVQMQKQWELEQMNRKQMNTEFIPDTLPQKEEPRYVGKGYKGAIPKVEDGERGPAVVHTPPSSDEDARPKKKVSKTKRHRKYYYSSSSSDSGSDSDDEYTHRKKARKAPREDTRGTKRMRENHWDMYSNPATKSRHDALMEAVFGPL